ncbi:MAG: GTP-binding protein [Ectothiorhodospiraceae bacterium]|nr:GTP-binding protein [Ectothiorhodospiraceae bacterium]
MLDVETYFKLIVTGSVNSGKTTFVKTISEIEAFTTDEMATEDDVMQLKQLTTVAMDYGRRTIDDDIVLHIYGTPGQERFDFMWDILVVGAFGVIFLADSTDKPSLEKTKNIIAFFTERYDLPYLMCVTKLDLADSIGYDEVVDFINQPQIKTIPLKTIDPNECMNALVTFLTLAVQKEEDTESGDDNGIDGADLIANIGN